MLDISSFDGFQWSLIYTFTFILGACLGSFASAIIPREIKGQSWFAMKGDMARSHCAHCQKPLSYKELLPILSYLLQKKKCACGQFQIPLFYPALELGFALTAIIILYFNGLNFLSAGLIVSLPFLAAISWLNLHNQMMSDRLLIILSYIAVAASLFNFPHTDLWDGIYAALFIAVLASFFKWMAQRISSASLYGWDVIKLWVIIGFWLGVYHTGYFLFLVGLGGVLWILFRRKIKTGRGLFPYGFYSTCIFLFLTMWF